MTSREQQYERELGTLSEIAQILATRYGQHEMLKEVLSTLEHRLGMVRGTIMLLTSNEKELVVEEVRNAVADIPADIRYKWGEGVTGRVVETGQPALIPRISQEPLFRDRIHRRKEQSEENVSFICVPIKIGNEVVGTLSVDVPFGDDIVLENYGRTMSIVSSMIANDVKARRRAHLEREDLENENLRLRDVLGEDFRPENIIGNSKGMRDVYQRIRHVTHSDTTVLIRGESGTGKELVASAIHYNSNRKGRPFVIINCAVLSESLLESELFGHEKGAFTGAVSSRIGRVELANGGTLLLDEIGEISPAMQAKLLRVLQEREFERLGNSMTLKADVRIIAATNRDLEQAVSDKLFREDLYYRINVFPIFLPPLRERKEDILTLANHFLDKYSKKLRKEIRRISTPAINMMMAYHWPGNVRELENCIEYAALLSNDGVVHGFNLPPTLQTPTGIEVADCGALKSKVQFMERDMLVDALKHVKGNMSAAARELGITPRMVRYKVQRLGITSSDIGKQAKGRKK